MKAGADERRFRLNTGVGALPLEILDGIVHGNAWCRIPATVSSAFMRLDSRSALSLNCDVGEPSEKSQAQATREWMQSIVDGGLSVAEWAKRSGVARSTIFRALKPTYEFMTSSRTLAKLAESAGREPPALPSQPAADVRIVPQFLPVRYRVQAGLWYEVGSEEPISDFDYAVGPNPRFGNWPQWLEEVVGDSVNEAIPHKHLAHVVDAVEMGYEAQEGDFVVVERRRDGGATRERTIKQVVITGDGKIQLWPRSTNPKWSEPVELSNGAREGEYVEVAIVGLVIGSYNPTLLRRR